MLYLTLLPSLTGPISFLMIFRSFILNFSELSFPDLVQAFCFRRILFCEIFIFVGHIFVLFWLTHNADPIVTYSFVTSYTVKDTYLTYIKIWKRTVNFIFTVSLSCSLIALMNSHCCLKKYVLRNFILREDHRQNRLFWPKSHSADYTNSTCCKNRPL